MAVNKVVFGNDVKIDLTEDTVTQADVATGKSFHLPNGVKTTGTGLIGNIYVDGQSVVIPSFRATVSNGNITMLPVSGSNIVLT